MLFLTVKALPRDALVEKQALLHTGRRFLTTDEDEPSLHLQTPTFTRGDHPEVVSDHVIDRAWLQVIYIIKVVKRIGRFLNLTTRWTSVQ
jgi:hypothetical protein